MVHMEHRGTSVGQEMLRVLFTTHITNNGAPIIEFWWRSVVLGGSIG